ncbi:MAG: amidohydrolase family protein [Candidatus Aminicenantes bacterium]|nr:amidohydrolase family protein [Candidatus Aminicenantes bacterium]
MSLKIRKICIFTIICIFTAYLNLFADKQRNSDQYDILIKNAIVIDGSLNEPFIADVAINGDIIVKVGPSIKGKAGRVIDAAGLYICPGFIDLHTHVDEGMYFPENRPCLNYLTQGVTSVVAGQCGGSAWPIFEKAKDIIHTWSKEGIGPNAALLVGHGTIREIVMGREQREPSQEEMEKMKGLVKEAMEQGAYGLSTGLIYAPSSYANTSEIIELVKVIAPYNGIYHSHIRNEREFLLNAIEEAIEICRQTDVPSHISHFKVMGIKNWGLTEKACLLIEKARQEGLKITADQYPFRFANNYPYRNLIPSSLWRTQTEYGRLRSEDITLIFGQLQNDHLIELYTKITPYIPISKHHQNFLNSLPRERLVDYVGRSFISLSDFQGADNLRERRLFLQKMQDPEKAEEIRKNLKEIINNNFGPENLIVAICHEHELEGKNLVQVASIKQKSLADTVIELDLMGAKCIPYNIGEEDIEHIMQKEYVATSSDGEATFYGIGLPHIRSYSTFLYKIKKYALEKKIISLPHAIRSQTSLAAQIMNWDDRGWIKPGFKADIVILDLENIAIKTSITNPHQYCSGVEYLLINGKLVLDGKKFTGALPGRILKPNQ